MKRKGFTLIEMMVVVAIVGVLAAALTPQISNFIYKAKVSATSSSLKNFKMALDMMINDLGVKPPLYGGTDMNSDGMGLLRRSAVSGTYQSLWNGPYAKAYPVTRTAPLLADASAFWYYYSWPGGSGTWVDWCGTANGILLHTIFFNYQAKQDVENVIIGRTDPAGNSWLYWCGFYDGTPTW